MPKWVYEIILEKVPPFNRLPSGYDVLGQMLLLETVGIILAILFSMASDSISMMDTSLFLPRKMDRTGVLSVHTMNGGTAQKRALLLTARM